MTSTLAVPKACEAAAVCLTRNEIDLASQSGHLVFHYNDGHDTRVPPALVQAQDL